MGGPCRSPCRVLPAARTRPGRRSYSTPPRSIRRGFRASPTCRGRARCRSRRSRPSRASARSPRTGRRRCRPARASAPGRSGRTGRRRAHASPVHPAPRSTTVIVSPRPAFDGDVDRRPRRAVLHRVVEQGPQDLFETVRIGHGEVRGTLDAQRRTVDRHASAPHVRSTSGWTAKTSCCGLSTPASSRDTTSSWLTIRLRRSAWCAIDSRSPRAESDRPSSGSELGGERGDARERCLEVVRDATQEVGLHARHPVQLVGLVAHLCIEQRVLQGRSRVLADEGEQRDLCRRRIEAALPRSVEDRPQAVADGDVGDRERPPWSLDVACRAVGVGDRCPALELADRLRGLVRPRSPDRRRDAAAPECWMSSPRNAMSHRA